MPDVVVVGDINVDILAPVDRYPDVGGHALAEAPHMTGGGSAANTAVTLGHLGLQVTMLGRVGADPLAEVALRGLESADVDVSRVRRDPEATTGFFFVVVTPDGERTMFGGRGANGRLSPDDVDRAAIQAARWVHLSGYPLLTASGQATLEMAIDVARSAGVPVSLDVGIGPSTEKWRAAVLELAPAIEILLPNRVEATRLVAESDPSHAARRLHALDVPTVAVKLGRGGCHVLAPMEEHTVPAFDIDPVDSTGAGDAFDAGLIAGRLAGFELRASALLANALGGLGTTVLGADSGHLRPARLLEFLQEHRDEPRWAVWRGEFDTIRRWLKHR